MKHHLVLRVVAKLLIPSILLFALYTQFHGDYGPGGGFQAGVIYAAGFILHALVFGLESTKKLMPLRLLKILSAVGVMLYAGTGLAGLLRGHNFLDYYALAQGIRGQELGVMLVEAGVGLTVSSVMIILFYLFADQDTDE